MHSLRRFLPVALLLLTSAPDGANKAVKALAATPPAPPQAMQDYVRPGQLDPLPDLKASLYLTPWRSNARTVSAYNALSGVGVYYKHIPEQWTQDEQNAIAKQLAAAGIKRMRIAPHLAIYITATWNAPKDDELLELRHELRACAAADIRPCVTFVHITPMGKPGTRDLQDWWHQGELMPSGEVGSPAFMAYQNKTYQALLFVLKEARSAGFTQPASYDLEMGQNLWWGAPAVSQPLPDTGLEALRPGGRIYEFDRGLIQKLRADGFNEPTVWWSQMHHDFEECHDDDLPPECAGRASSFYQVWTGVTTQGWLNHDQGGKPIAGPQDTWPVRGPMSFIDAGAPTMALARPEGWMVDRTRHDNLIALMRSSAKPVAMVSIGTVPDVIPDWKSSGMNGWQLKARGDTRALAMWLNQGAPFVLLHSAYEPWADKDLGESTHSLIPTTSDPLAFKYETSEPLRAIRSFCDGLQGAKPIDKLDDLHFQFALDDDPVLIAASDDGKTLHASDAVALLPYQLDEHHYAVAAYIVTPNIAVRMTPLRMTLRIDRAVTGDGVHLIVPASGTTGTAQLAAQDPQGTTIRFDVRDEVTWLKFEVR